MTGQRFDLPPGDYLVQIALPVEEGEVTRTTAVPIKLAPGEHRELSMRDPIGALRDALAETAVAVLLETGRGGVDAVRELAPQAASAMRELGEASVAGLREIVFSSPRM